jgi:hypothetical protein
MPDDLNELIEAAKLIGGHKTKKAAVATALDEYVSRRKRLQAVEAFGTIDFDPTYNYKLERKAKRTF